MGERDLSKLGIINSEIQRLNKLYDWHFHFHVDSGHKENAIQIEDNGSFHIPTMESLGKILIPDLIDFSHRMIIEFEEEAKPNTGYCKSKRRKGHFPELLNVKDEDRDRYYKLIKFDLFKVWESDLKKGTWKMMLLIWLELHAINVNYTKIPA